MYKDIEEKLIIVYLLLGTKKNFMWILSWENLQELKLNYLS